MKKILALSLVIAIVYITGSEIGTVFSRTSNFLALEPTADSPTLDYYLPSGSAESPAPDDSPAESPKPDSTSFDYFDVTHYGAVADGKTDSSSAFLTAWKDACSYKGNSTLFIPKGTFYIGPVTFSGPCHNNGSPKIEILGTLKAPISLSDFPSPEWILFKNLNGFNLTGIHNSMPTLDAQGEQSWSNASCRRVMTCHNFPTALKLVNVSHGKVRNISLLNSKAIHVSIHNCENIDLSGLNIEAPESSPNTDGINIRLSNNISISSSTIGVGDDCVAIGPGSMNISVSSVHCGPGHGISVGSLGWVTNEKEVVGVHVSKCTFNGTQNGVRVKTWPGAPPTNASNLVFENISMINVSNPIIIDQTYCPSGICKSKQPSKVKISDVSFKNISGTYYTKLGVTLRCSSAVPCENLLLVGINLNYTKQAHIKPGLFVTEGAITDLQVLNSQF